MKRKRIVVVRQLGGIGDNIMLSCVYRGLREKYPKHLIQLATCSSYLCGSLIDIAEHNPFIDEIHSIEPFEATTKKTMDVWAYTRGSPSLEDTNLWFQTADIQIDLNTACVDYEWEAMREPGNVQKPRYQIWCEKAGVIPSTYKPVYVIKKEERSEAAQTYTRLGLDPKKCILLGTTAHDKRRALGIGSLKEICTIIASRGFTPIIVDPTFNFPEYPAFNGKRIRELMALIEPAATLVSVDSGVLHMGGALGVPVVGIFGPTDPEMRMKPYLGSAIDINQLHTPCTPCWYGYHCTHHSSRLKPFACLSKIPSALIAEEAVRWATSTL
jgi:hypothetical protein